MKKQIRTLIMMGALVGALPWSAMAGHDAMTPAEREKKLDKMASELNLSQDQKNKVRMIKDEKYRKIDEAMKQADDQIRGVLSAEQQAKFDKMKEKR